jgi:hypothetical protein
VRELVQRVIGEARRKDDKPTSVFGYELDPKTLTPTRKVVNRSAPGDYGADPLGNGKHKMVPSGDIVDTDERNRRLAHLHLRK